MLTYSCLTGTRVCSHRREYDFGIKDTNTTFLSSHWFKALTSLFLLYCFCGTLEANDIRLSNLTQSPSNTVSTSTPVNYSLTVENVYQGDDVSIRVSIGVYRNEMLIPADSGEISATGCVADGPYFSCNDLYEGNMERPTFTWNNPTPGSNNMQFTAFCQLLPLQDPPVPCPSSPYTLSIPTIVVQPPNAVANTTGSPVVLDAGTDDALDVIFDATESTDSDGIIESFEWFEGDTLIATGSMPTVNLTAGDHLIRLRVTDNDGLSDEDSVTYTILSEPTANAGPDRNLTDTDNDGTESVRLDGTSSSDPGGNITNYTWFESNNQIATGATPTVPLSVGTHTITLQILDNHESTDEDQLVITILPATDAPTADAGPDQQLTDSDNNGTEDVTLDGSGSIDTDGNIVNYAWYEFDAQETPIATGVSPTLPMSVATHILTLRVTDDSGAESDDQVVVTVLPAPNAPIADAGPDQQVTDSDNDSAEEVLLDGTGSSDPEGSIVNYEWFEFDTLVATGDAPAIVLDVGTHDLTLRVTDDDGMVSEDQVVVTVLPAPNAPVADAGPDQQLTDSDNSGSEEVTLDGSGSVDSGDGTIVNYVWFAQGSRIAVGASPTVALSVGEHNLTLRVTNNDNLVGEDQVLISVAAAPNVPVADAGEDQILIDTDADGSEQVTLNATASTDADGSIISNQWFENGTQIASGATATVILPIGIHTVTLRVTDNDNITGEDQVTISIFADANADTVTPIANAGPDQTLLDTDGDGAASVTLDGASSTDPDGSIVSYQWLEGSEEIATGVTPTVALSVGVHTLTLTVTDDAGLTHQDQVTITIRGEEHQLLIIAGSNLSGSMGETLGPFTVKLVDSTGSPVNDRSIAWQVTPENAATLSESESTTDQAGHASTNMTIQQTGVILLTATSANIATVEFTVNSIAETPGLSENQQAVGSTMDDLCPSLAEKQSSGTLTAAEQDLLMTCEDLVTESGTAATLSRLAPEEVAAQGTASMEAAGTQLANINTRLVALRRGDIGMNLGGLTVNYAGIAFNQRLFEGMFYKDKKARGGGAGDIDELQGRWGAFINGNVNFGQKDETQRESGFDFDTTGITFGLDYRFNHQFVAGGALGFSRYDSDYNDAAGNLEMDAWILSAYGTYYRDNNIYVDGLIQIGSNSYDTKRRINAAGAPDQFGLGDTDGTEYAFNISAGYEYRRDAWTLTPYGRLSYTRAEIDPYTEVVSNPAAVGVGSVLRIGDQELKSMVLVLGGNFSYTVNTTNAVLKPQLRFEWEHEFEDDSRFINARFVNDPTRSEFAIETEEADENYFNLGIGLSAVFAQNRSGYIFYETRLDQDDVTMHMINTGLRIEF